MRQSKTPNNVEVLEGLEKEGMLDILIKRGIIPLTQKTNLLIYREVMKQRNEGNVKKMQSYQNVADLFKVSETTVRDAVRWCEL